MDILSRLAPTISASTLDEGSKQRTFGKGSWGAFISGGRVVGGGRSDIGSVSVGLRDRRVMSERDVPLEAIEGAIDGRNRNESYNELIIEQPEVAGVYCKWFKDIPLTENVSLQNGNGVGYDSWWGRMKNVMDRNVPVFVLTQDNQTHLLYDIDTEKRTFKVAAKISPDDLVGMPGVYKQHTGVDEKRAAVGRVFEHVSYLLTEEEKAAIVVPASLSN